MKNDDIASAIAPLMLFLVPNRIDYDLGKGNSFLLFWLSNFHLWHSSLIEEHQA